MATDLTDRMTIAKRGTLASVLANMFLAVIKVLSGVVGHSYALIADGIESVIDILSSLAVLGGFKIAAMPPDENHPYGHGKAESLASVVIALALFAAALGIAIQSTREILTPHHGPAPFTLAVLVGIIVTKEILFRFVFRLGDSIVSTAMKADAWHHRSDAITSGAAFLGISIALIGGEGFESADDWFALVACSIISYNGYRLLREGISEVMDASPSPEIVQQIRSRAGACRGVVRIDECRMRKSGFGYFVDIHVMVNDEMPVREAHKIAHRVKAALCQSSLNVFDVLVHIEPSLTTSHPGPENPGIDPR